MDKKILIIVLMVLYVMSVVGLVFWAWYLSGQLTLAEGINKIKSYKVGVIVPGEIYETTWLSTKDALKELGIKERINAYYYVENTGCEDAALTEAVRKILKKKPDVIYTISTLATAKVKSLASEGMPVVFNLVGDPIGAGFAADYSSSASNFTGCTNLTVDLAAKRLSLFKEAFPAIGKVLVIYNAEDQSSFLELVPLKEEGEMLGLEIEARSASTSLELQELVNDITLFRYDGIFLSPSALLADHLDLVLAKARELKLPTIGYEESLAEKGVSITYGASFKSLGEQCARTLWEVLNGRTPRAIPIQTPAKLDLVVNVKELKAIGLSVTAEILSRTDRVVEDDDMPPSND